MKFSTKKRVLIWVLRVALVGFLTSLILSWNDPRLPSPLGPLMVFFFFLALVFSIVILGFLELTR